MKERLKELLRGKSIDQEVDVEYVADFLLSEGVIVPPCKVGDTVYVLSQGAGFSVVWNVYEAKVTDIHLDQWGILSVRVKTARTEIGGYCDKENVFLTREEAEKALAERSKNEHRNSN